MGGKRPGAGRPKGVPNKLSASIKDAIKQAFDKVGGPAYLIKIAETNPAVFCTLIGKLVPTELSTEESGGITVNLVTGVPRQ